MSVTKFRLCKEFGFTPNQLGSQPAKTVQEFILILNELDRQAEEEKQKMERKGKWRSR
jgi:hypothetical protein